MLATLEADLVSAIEAYAVAQGGTATVDLSSRTPISFTGSAHYDGKLMKAAFNGNLYHEDANSFIHNAAYVGQLMFDSIADLGGSTTVTRPEASAAIPAGLADEWLESGHASGASWGHYDWDGSDSNVDPWNVYNDNRIDCQRCHTATGVANLMADQTNYDATNNDYSHLAPGENEVLGCFGCHTDYSTGATPDLSAGVIFPSGEAVNVGDASDVCIACHQGRESGVGVDAKIAAGTYSQDYGIGFGNRKLSILYGCLKENAGLFG